MITYPNAKINIGLNIVSKREDGYHNIETVFYPIPIRDALEFVPSAGDADALVQTGIKVDGNAEQNLVMKALRIFKEDFRIPNLDIFLHKNIPFGAGLGGGSSDAAFMLKMLNEEFKIGLPERILIDISSRIGADCAFFVSNKPVFATGIGNIFQHFNFSLKGLHIVVVKPDIHVSTPLAYSMVKPQKPEKNLMELLSSPISQWRDTVKNDFEESVFSKFPEIARIKERLYELGATYASMSGSGSSVFGIFDREVELPTDLTKHYTFKGILD